MKNSHARRTFRTRSRNDKAHVAARLNKTGAIRTRANTRQRRTSRIRNSLHAHEALQQLRTPKRVSYPRTMVIRLWMSPLSSVFTTISVKQKNSTCICKPGCIIARLHYVSADTKKNRVTALKTTDNIEDEEQDANKESTLTIQNEVESLFLVIAAAAVALQRMSFIEDDVLDCITMQCKLTKIYVSKKIAFEQLTYCRITIDPFGVEILLSRSTSQMSGLFESLWILGEKTKNSILKLFSGCFRVRPNRKDFLQIFIGHRQD